MKGSTSNWPESAAANEANKTDCYAKDRSKSFKEGSCISRKLCLVVGNVVWEVYSTIKMKWSEVILKKNEIYFSICVLLTEYFCWKTRILQFFSGIYFVGKSYPTSFLVNEHKDNCWKVFSHTSLAFFFWVIRKSNKLSKRCSTPWGRWVRGAKGRN